MNLSIEWSHNVLKLFIGLFALIVCSLSLSSWLQQPSCAGNTENTNPVKRLLSYIDALERKEGIEIGKAVDLLGTNDFSRWTDVTHAQKLPLELTHVWENCKVYSPDFGARDGATRLYVAVRDVNGKQICYQFVFCDYPIPDSYLSIRFAPER